MSRYRTEAHAPQHSLLAGFLAHLPCPLPSACVLGLDGGSLRRLHPLSSFQEGCCLGRRWGYFWEPGPNPGLAGRAVTTILPGPVLWKPSGVQGLEQAHSKQRGCRWRTGWGAVLASTDPSAGLGAEDAWSHSLEGLNSLAENSDECRDREEIGLREGE